MENYDVLVIGAGVAGLSTAYHLGVENAGSICVLEKESVPAAKASGKSAGMLHHFHPDPEMRRMLERAIRRLKLYDLRKQEHICRECPSLWLLPAETMEELRSDNTRTGRWRVTEPGSVSDVLTPERIPDGARWVSFPEDGLVDPNTLASSLVSDLRDMEIDIRTDHHVREGERTEGRWHVKTDHGPFRSRIVVDAAGAWAEEVGHSFGGQAGELVPEARYLFQTDHRLFEHTPLGYYWDRVHDVYFREMSEGTLISVCESKPTPPGEPPGDVEPETMLAEELLSDYPRLADLSVQNYWCGQRTFASDRLPVIKSDDQQPGLVWSAGLGGHGITASMWVGLKTANLVINNLKTTGGRT